MSSAPKLSRRRVMAGGIVVSAVPLTRTARADDSGTVGGGHGGPGRVFPPLPIGDVAVVTDDASRTDLRRLLTGRITAVQFVLTGCSAICPVLGAIFTRVQDALGADPGAPPLQLLSLSLDPTGDTPQGFSAWLAKYQARPGWRGAIPQIDPLALAALLQRWGLRNGSSSSFHTEAVLLVNRDASIVFRCPDLPDPGAVARLMRQLAA